MFGLAAVCLALTVPFGAGPGAAATLDVGVYARVGADLSNVGVAGLATPFGYLYDRRAAQVNPYLHREELLHLEQWRALGPAFALAYLATGGDPFEPYNPLTWQVLPAADLRETADRDPLLRMWQPDVRRSPQFRIAFTAQGPVVRFLQMYGSLVEAARGRTRGAAAAAP